MSTHTPNFKLKTSSTASLKISDIVATTDSSSESVITDNSQRAAANETSLPLGKRPSLEEVEQLFGPLRIGESSVSRKELAALGAKVRGQDISAANTYFSEPDQGFIDALEFDPARVEQRLRMSGTQDNQLVPTLLFEIATHRSTDAAPLLREMSASASPTAMGKINDLLNCTQRLEIFTSPAPEHLPGWVDQTKSRAMTGMGAGLQAYGLYSAYIGTIDALKKGQWDEVTINVGGGAAEILSLGLERSLTKTGEAMIRNGAMAFEQFGKTSMGKWLCRSAGLIASVLTLPFDLYTAIKAFNAAAEAQGKQAQDLYVTGGLSVASAALSLLLGGAALLGFQAAGPVGLAAAAILIAGARIYSATRVVDDIDDYIELTVNERWRAGWFAFTGQDQDSALMDRFAVAKTYSDYSKALESKSIGWLSAELKDSVEAVVNGRFEVEAQPTRLYKYRWDEAKGDLPYITPNTPVVRETNDVYNARDGLLSGNPSVITGQSGPSKGVFWQLGGGNDTVEGVLAKPNYFNYGTGRKELVGGDKDDSFLFQSAPEALNSAPATGHVGVLLGGSGNDLLWLQGEYTRKDNDPLYIGYDIDLKYGSLDLRPADTTKPSVPYSNIDSIEKVETLAGAANRVIGSDKADVIGANGDDHVNAGAGDDHISIRGGHSIVDGGVGNDTYYLDRMSLRVSIVEDGQQPSTVHLGVPLEFIQGWCIREHALVIKSLRDDHPWSPQRELVLESVYQTLNGKCRLRNDKWLFITEDGYHLQPDWPAEIVGPGEHAVSMIILTAGSAKTSPILLNDRAHTIRSLDPSFYFVSRDSYHSTLYIPEHGKKTRSTLYIDFDSTEILNIKASYTVEATRPGAFTVLTYKNVHFTITFVHGGGLLVLQRAIRENPTRKSNMGAGILAGPWEMTHDFILVMRDGVSYHLDYPQNSYREDAADPGYKIIDSRASLRERAGKHIFVRPAVEKRALKATPQRIELKTEPHNATYWLEGRSASYDVFPASNTTIKLTTAKTENTVAQSSTWNIYTQHLQENISRQQLTIQNNLLKIGSAHFHLPPTDDPLLALETVDVITSSGDRYRVHTLFGLISLCSINALAYPDTDAIVALIQHHKALDELENENIPIRNIRLNDSTFAHIYYDTDTDSWRIDSNPSRPIQPEHLTIGPIPHPV